MSLLVADAVDAQDSPDAPVHLEPLQLTGITEATFGLWAWSAALVVTTAARPWLVERGHGDWPWICAAGVGLALIALRFTRKRADRLGLPR